MVDLRYEKECEYAADLVVGDDGLITFGVYPRACDGSCAPGYILPKDSIAELSLGVSLEVPEGYSLFLYSISTSTLGVDGGVVILRGKSEGELTLPIVNKGKHAAHITPGTPVAKGLLVKEESINLVEN